MLSVAFRYYRHFMVGYQLSENGKSCWSVARDGFTIITYNFLL